MPWKERSIVEERMRFVLPRLIQFPASEQAISTTP